MVVERILKTDKSNMISLNTGVYFPSSGLSNSEIASLSRSMHKSQGFGSTGSRGNQNEYIQLLKGEMPKNETNLFEGIDTTWTRVKGGEEIKKILDKVEHNFNFKQPSASISELVKAYKLIDKLENEHWRKFKLEQIKEIIAACAGLYLEGKSNSNSSYATINDKIEIAIEAINRSDKNIVLEEVIIYPQDKTIKIDKNLDSNISYIQKEEIIVSDKLANTTPYWLKDKGTLGMYNVEDKSLIGEPRTVRQLKITFKLRIDNTPINYNKDIIYKYNDPVKGEVYQPFEIVPEVYSNIASNFIIFNEYTPKEIPVKIVARKDSVQGIAKLKVPENWKVSPDNIPYNILKKGNEQIIIFTVTPTKDQSEGYIYSSLQSKNRTFDNSLVEINYDHIPLQTILMPAEAKVVRLNLVKKGNSIGYIKGAGDDVPEYLKQVGYQVTIIDPVDISENVLKEFDAVMVGIRAYNIVDELILKQPIILDYVKNGGNVIVQYNTNHRLKVKDNIAPYKLQLSRDRVTEENAKVKFLDKDHEILNFPNKITSHDFDGWVQERGLYFPDEWADEFTPILSFNDKGESPKNGSLLVAKYGKGYYMYTGLSFFRELPAGVPGAYKLLTNMISIGKNDFEKEIKE
jgi:hypothetical protein